MKEVKIQIENCYEADLLGKEPEISYTTLRFNEDKFIGYWITKRKKTRRCKTPASCTVFVREKTGFCD